MVMREISSLQHPLVKHLVKLREDRHYRYAQGKVLVSGKKLVSELLPLFPSSTLILEEGCTLPALSNKTVVVSPNILRKITGHPSPEGMAAEIAMPAPAVLKNISLLLILDGISDPGNLGTLMRTALGLGWQGVFLTPGSTDPYNERALSAAKGATFKISWRSGSWEELDRVLQENSLTLVAADPKGKPVQKTSVTPPLALALGNESQGLSPSLRTKALAVSIPMHSAMESLNVATAGAILMFSLGALKYE